MFVAADRVEHRKQRGLALVVDQSSRHLQQPSLQNRDRHMRCDQPKTPLLLRVFVGRDATTNDCECRQEFRHTN